MLPAKAGRLISPDFLFPKASGSIHPSWCREQRLNTALRPTALAFILKPCFPLSWRPPSAPWDHICSDFGGPHASWPHPRNSLSWCWRWGVPPAQPCPEDSCSLGMEGGLPNAFFGHFLPSWDWGSLLRLRPQPRRSRGHSRLPISDAGKSFPPIPPHPWTAAPIQAQSWGAG